jgi:hypothetical protein
MSHEVTIEVEYEYALGTTKPSSIPIRFTYRCPNKDNKSMKVKFYFDIHAANIFKHARITKIV